MSKRRRRALQAAVDQVHKRGGLSKRVFNRRPLLDWAEGMLASPPPDFVELSPFQRRLQALKDRLHAKVVEVLSRASDKEAGFQASEYAVATELEGQVAQGELADYSVHRDSEELNVHVARSGAFSWEAIRIRMDWPREQA